MSWVLWRQVAEIKVFDRRLGDPSDPRGEGEPLQGSLWSAAARCKVEMEKAFRMYIQYEKGWVWERKDGAMSTGKRSGKNKPGGLWNCGILKKVSASLRQERTELQLCGRMRQLCGKYCPWIEGEGTVENAVPHPASVAQLKHRVVALLPTGHVFSSAFVYRYRPGLHVSDLRYQISKKDTWLKKNLKILKILNISKVFYALPNSTVVKLDTVDYPLSK